MVGKEYQYETSPRKLKPEYEPQKNRKVVKKTNKNKKINTKPKKNNKINIIVYILIGFSVLFTISYRNSQINESFAENQKLKKEITEIQKENEQLNISIQNSLNLNQVRQSAKELLGMQELTNKQKIFINLPKKDYVEPAAEEIIIEEDENWLTSIINSIKNIF